MSSELTKADQTKLINKINTIVGSLTEAKKAAPKAGGLRNFMQTQKNDLKEMVLVDENPSAAGSALN